MANKKFSELTLYEQNLRKYHKASDRHILVVETDMSPSDVLKIFKFSDKERKAKNEVVAMMKKAYEQLIRTKRYRKLLLLYGKTKDKAKKTLYAEQLKQMQEEYHLTWEFCRKAMQPICRKYDIGAPFYTTCAEDVWSGVKKILYSDGEILHFSKFGKYPCIRAKEYSRGIPMSAKNDVLMFKFGKIKFGINIKDRFQQDEVNAVLNYMQNSEKENMYAVKHFTETGECVSTYRPCYATLVPKKIRGKYRLYLHLTIEGKAVRKYDRYGNPRHHYGKGMVGSDIGTQTFAYTSDTEVGLKNLSERGNSIQKSERLERLYYRAMDRSRRATNPQNYNEDGTIKKGKKTWVYSKHYKMLRHKHAELCRKNAINRHLAINEDANHLRSLGDIFVTEPKNASKLMKRAKETTVNKKTGKINRKKRFGKSIKNRCPGGFQSTVEAKFNSTGGAYVEVPNSYRASQYDHTADDYIKKKLSQRMYNLKDGTKVQRDWYSSFLLYCYDFVTKSIDKEKCNHEFERHLNKEKNLITWIKKNKIKVLNSGIKVA